ncbi:efflux RND transporter periplasmic adaptor subunit [Methylococcus sp. EFPC2]|uniref:efflux RND transporter periplasmic adaptor subunit n=1 Tax=Methylococcus sp. EFPC2 TaxID=2812648 RepID=UPI0019682B12|nr:hypothetical protein [Methylococcus sp. EFPC2]QSA96315.1 hypothetical protein JWZ97_13940 [Methylococcus sp. EFPC2]
MTPAFLRPTLLLALVCLTPWISGAPRDDDDDAPAPARTASAPAPAGGDAFTLNLPPARQQAAGIKTEPLDAASWHSETKAYATVLDLQALFGERARYRAAQSEVNIAEAAQRVAEKNLQRLSHLHREAIIPARELYQAEAQHSADLARLEAARNRLREIRETALQQWGETLFRRTIENESALYQALLARKQGLILLTASVETPPAQARLAAPGLADSARTARLISAAPRIDVGAQGGTWFYLAENLQWRAGQRLEAWLANADEASEGVAMPPSAVIWHEGRPWVYVKTGDDRFVRRPLDARQQRGDRWLVKTGFAAGEGVVVSGAQTLLSEELRRFIPDEDDD